MTFYFLWNISQPGGILIHLSRICSFIGHYSFWRSHPISLLFWTTVRTLSFLHRYLMSYLVTNIPSQAGWWQSLVTCWMLMDVWPHRYPLGSGVQDIQNESSLTYDIFPPINTYWREIINYLKTFSTNRTNQSPNDWTIIFTVRQTGRKEFLIQSKTTAMKLILQSNISIYLFGQVNSSIDQIIKSWRQSHYWSWDSKRYNMKIQFWPFPKRMRKQIYWSINFGPSNRMQYISLRPL